jgi:hypothetical protein
MWLLSSSSSLSLSDAKSQHNEDEEIDEHDDDEEAEEAEEADEGPYDIPFYELIESANGVGVMYEGYICGNRDPNNVSKVNIACHMPVEYGSQEFYYVVEAVEVNQLNTVTAMVSGDLIPAMRLFKDLICELAEEGKISPNDVVHIILSSSDMKAFFQNIGFKDVAVVLSTYVDPLLQQIVNRGSFRLAAPAGELLPMLEPYAGGEGPLNYCS